MGKFLIVPNEDVIFTPEEEIVHHLMLSTATLKRNGLFYGKLGISIAFFEYGRYRNNQIYTDFAIELKNSLPSKIDSKITCDFATGLCGFGWGIEYLIQRHFIGCENDDICMDIEKNAMSKDIRRMNDLSLETGLEGFIHYILIRLERTREQCKFKPFDEIYLKDTLNRLQSLKDEKISDRLRNLKQTFISYMDNGSLTYKPDICLFINNQEPKYEEDILSATLGLAEGLAGRLIRIIYK